MGNLSNVPTEVQAYGFLVVFLSGRMTHGNPGGVYFYVPE